MLISMRACSCVVDGRTRRKRFVRFDEVDVDDAVRQVTQISEEIF